MGGFVDLDDGELFEPGISEGEQETIMMEMLQLEEDEDEQLH